MTLAKITQILDSLSKATTDSYLEHAVIGLSSALEATFVFVADVNLERHEASTLALCERGKILPNFQYSLLQTPCENVAGDALCIHTSQVCSDFPEDQLLVEMGIEAYIGVPLYGREKEVLGILVALYTRPISNAEPEVALFRLFSNLIAMELERRQVEKNRRANEERFRDYAEASSDWFWEMNADSIFIYLSDRFFELTGFSSEDIYGYGREKLINPALEDIDSEKWLEHFSRLERREPFRNIEYQLMKQDGEIMSISANGNPIFDSEGKFTGYRGTGTDITERNKVEEELKKLSRAVESSSAIVIITDLNGIIEYVNPKFTEITGYTSDEATGQTPRLLKSGEQSEAFYIDLWNTILSGEV
ncbi:MAG: PAS domain S-box protein, partial [Proteobacteria bacterium]|nr:PAS domain S-box protein [Pseudomonadota bacterium]